MRDEGILSIISGDGYFLIYMRLGCKYTSFPLRNSLFCSTSGRLLKSLTCTTVLLGSGKGISSCTEKCLTGGLGLSH